MLLLLDFDDTLFDTELFNKKIAKIFLAHAVSLKDKEESYQKISSSYSFKKHIEVLKKDFGYHLQEKQVLGEIQKLVIKQAGMLLYKDTLPFLEVFSEKNIPMIVVSVGDASWQKMKIQASGIKKFFKKVCIAPPPHTSKASIIAQFCQVSQTPHVFVDDRPEVIEAVMKLKKDCPRLTVIRIRRGRHSHIDGGNADVTVSNLSEAKRYILNLRS